MIMSECTGCSKVSTSTLRSRTCTLTLSPYLDGHKLLIVLFISLLDDKVMRFIIFRIIARMRDNPFYFGADGGWDC